MEITTEQLLQKNGTTMDVQATQYQDKIKLLEETIEQLSKDKKE